VSAQGRETGGWRAILKKRRKKFHEKGFSGFYSQVEKKKERKILKKGADYATGQNKERVEEGTVGDWLKLQKK